MAEKNRWTLAVGMREASIRQHKEGIIKKFEDLLHETERHLRNYFVKPVLKEIREEIGSIIIEDKEFKGATSKQNIDQLTTKLRHCIKKFEDDYEKLIKPPKQTNVWLVANNENNDIENDAKYLNTQMNEIKKTELFNTMLKRDEGLMPLFTFLQWKPEQIQSRMREVFQQESLSLIRAFDIVSTSQKRLGNRIIDLAKRAEPYQTFNPLYEPITLPKLPNLICGRHSDSLKELSKYLLGNKVNLQRISESTLDHLIIFYMEEAAFALDDLTSYSMLKQRYEEKPGTYGHHTDKDPLVYDVHYFERKKEINKWMTAAKDLFTDIFNTIGKEYAFEYEGSTGLETIFIEDQNQVDSLARDENKDGYDKFIEITKQKFTNLGREGVIKKVDEFKRQMQNKNISSEEYKDKNSFYQQLINELFPQQETASSGR